MKLPPLVGAHSTKNGLSDAGRAMAKYQLGRRLTGQEDEPIVEFLKTLADGLNGLQL
jgi:hypothetical protein